MSHTTRHLLLAGFGGLLLLMAFAGVDTIGALSGIQHRNDVIRGDFLERNRLLNQIRSDLYLSGTYVRDYLVEPEPGKAESHRASLEKDRQEMGRALRRYAALPGKGEQKPFLDLRRELDAYWKVLEPCMRWSGTERQTRAFAFLRDEVYPRRTALLAVADQIAALNERQLDAGNRQVSELFSGSRFRLGLTILITLGLGILLATYSMTKILVLERQSERRFQENVDAHAELKHLSARLVEAQETERRAISRELHDEVGQSLSALVVGLSNLAASAPAGRLPQLAEQIDELKKLAGRSVGVVRDMTLLLRPSMLDDLGLVPALQWQAREVSKRSGLIVNFASEELAGYLEDEYKTAIYRVVQEALHNCEKHARAREIRITLKLQPETLLLSVQDDGRGFAPGAEKGLGLRGMQERIENLGGIFNVESEPGRGLLITVRLPLKKGRPALAQNGFERH